MKIPINLMKTDFFLWQLYNLFKFLANRQRLKEIRVYPDFDPETLKMSALRFYMYINAIYLKKF